MVEPDNINEEVKRIWERNAAFWDEQFGEGNNFQRLLIGPSTDRLLRLQPGEVVLDAACGNGHYARHLARRGATVVAFDGSATFIERANQRTDEVESATDTRLPITFHVIDATDFDAMVALGTGHFDAVICLMAVMDLPTIDPLFRAARALLKDDGRFVFATMHPCFNQASMAKLVEEVNREGEFITSYAIKISRYISMESARGIGIIGQPEAQYYFDRPLSVLLDTCFRAGFVVNGMEEPVFDESAKARGPFSWEHYHEIPPVLIVRAVPHQR